MPTHRQLAAIELPYLVETYTSNGIIINILERKGLGYDRITMYNDIKHTRDENEDNE